MVLPVCSIRNEWVEESKARLNPKKPMKNPSKFKKSLFGLAAAVAMSSSAQAVRFIVNINQINLSEVNQVLTTKQGALACDGVWCLLQNSQSISKTQWNSLVSVISNRQNIIAEDVYGQSIGYNSVQNTIGKVDATMVYIPRKPVWGDEVLDNSQINIASNANGGEIIILARTYLSGSKTKLDAGLNNSKVVGAVFEIPTNNPGFIRTAKIDDGIRAVLSKGKKAYVLLTAGQDNTGIKYRNQAVSTATALKNELGGNAVGAAWDNPNLFLVVAAYERDRVKVSFLGAGGVSEALQGLKALR